MSDRSGRPPRNDGPAFPHDEVDRLLVHGEVVEKEDGTPGHVRFPSYRELAERFGVAHSLIGKFAKEHNCLARRRQAEKRAQEMSDVKLAEMRADDFAVSRDDGIRCIDRYLAQFEQAIIEGRVRCDSPSDYNLMTRLKAFLLGDADSRQETLGGVTLEDIQAAHARLLKTMEEATPEMTGMVMYPVPANLGSDDDDEGDGGAGGGSAPLLH